MGARREIIDVKQRHGAAGDLLRTSIWITVQRLQDGRRIERGGLAYGQRDAAGALHQIREHIGGQGQALAFCQGPDRAPRQNLRRWFDVERIVPRQRQPVWSTDIDVDLRRSSVAGIECQRHRGALLRRQVHRRGGVPGHFYWPRVLSVVGAVPPLSPPLSKTTHPLPAIPLLPKTR